MHYVLKMPLKTDINYSKNPLAVWEYAMGGQLTVPYEHNTQVASKDFQREFKGI
jgi:hypothetical protein